MTVPGLDSEDRGFRSIRKEGRVTTDAVYTRLLCTVVLFVAVRRELVFMDMLFTKDSPLGLTLYGHSIAGRLALCVVETGCSWGGWVGVGGRGVGQAVGCLSG